MKRFAAKLLFQFRIVTKAGSGKRRICEERIVNFESRNAKAALSKAKKIGDKAQHSYENSDGDPVYFEFVGIMDLICLELVCDENEVWYDISTRVCPMERKHKFIPNEEDLDAIRNEE